jgi:DNA-binding transcriptional regulator YhcF (GntR family)
MGSVVAEIPEKKLAAHRREPVEAAFREAVRAGRRVGLTEKELHHIIEEALQWDDTNVQGGNS